MNDFRVIRNDDGSLLAPEDTTVFHETFNEKLLAWFASDLDGHINELSTHIAKFPSANSAGRGCFREKSPET